MTQFGTWLRFYDNKYSNKENGVTYQKGIITLLKMIKPGQFSNLSVILVTSAKYMRFMKIRLKMNALGRARAFGTWFPWQLDLATDSYGPYHIFVPSPNVCHT